MAEEDEDQRNVEALDDMQNETDSVSEEQPQLMDHDLDLPENDLNNNHNDETENDDEHRLLENLKNCWEESLKKRLAAFQHLEISSAQINHLGFEYLKDSILQLPSSHRPSKVKLERLEIDQTNGSFPAFVKFIHSLGSHLVEFLLLEKGRSGEPWISENMAQLLGGLCRMPKLCSITITSGQLFGNSISTECLSGALLSPSNDSLQELAFDCCPIDKEFLQNLGQAFSQRQRLKSLTFNRCLELGDDHLRIFVESMATTNRWPEHLAWTTGVLSPESFPSLARLMSSLDAVQHLDVSGNRELFQIKDGGDDSKFVHFLKSIEVCPCLGQLVVKDCRMGVEIRDRLCMALGRNRQTLWRFDMRGTVEAAAIHWDAGHWIKPLLESRTLLRLELDSFGSDYQGEEFFVSSMQQNMSLTSVVLGSKGFHHNVTAIRILYRNRLLWMIRTLILTATRQNSNNTDTKRRDNTGTNISSCLWPKLVERLGVSYGEVSPIYLFLRHSLPLHSYMANK